MARLDEELVALVAQAGPERRRRARRLRIVSPPIFWIAVATAALAPRSRTASVSRHHTLALSGSGWPAHACKRSSASPWRRSKRSVVVATGIGSTFSDTSQIAPSAPHEPASRRDTS